MGRLGRNEKIEARRMYIAKLINEEGKTRREIAEELGISLTTVDIDIKSLEIAGMVRRGDKKKTASEDKINSSELEYDKMYISPEDRYKQMVINSIMNFYKNGDYENAIKYIEVLQSENYLSEEERKKFNKIRINLQQLRNKQEEKIFQGGFKNTSASEITSKEDEILRIIRNLIGEKDQGRVSEITRNLISKISSLTDEQRLNLQQIIDRIEEEKVKDIDTDCEVR